MIYLNEIKVLLFSLSKERKLEEAKQITNNNNIIIKAHLIETFSIQQTNKQQKKEKKNRPLIYLGESYYLL